MTERIQNVVPKEWNGIHFRSSLEADTAKTLDALGIPYKYEERKITLQESFRSPFQKEKVRALTYTPDFEIGNIMIECKGFETPEWKIKKKLLFKYLEDKEPKTIFYQIHDCKKSLIQVLDKYWTSWGYCIQTLSFGTRSKPPIVSLHDSISQALQNLHLEGKNIGPILNGLITNKPVYKHYWKLIKITL